MTAPDRATPDPLSDPRVTALVDALNNALLWTAEDQNRARWRDKARAALRAIEEGGE